MKKRYPRRGFTLTEIAIVLAIIGLVLAAIWTAAAYASRVMRIERMTKGTLAVISGLQTLGAQNPAALRIGSDQGCTASVSACAPPAPPGCYGYTVAPKIGAADLTSMSISMGLVPWYLLNKYGNWTNGDPWGGIYLREKLPWNGSNSCSAASGANNNAALMNAAVNAAVTAALGAGLPIPTSVSMPPSTPGYTPATLSYSSLLQFSYMNVPVDDCIFFLTHELGNLTKAGLSMFCTGPAAANSCTGGGGPPNLLTPVTNAQIIGWCQQPATAATTSEVSLGLYFNDSH